MITRNVGKMDRSARIVLGLALFAGYFASSDSSYSWLYLVGGAIGLITGVLGSCGIYSALGITTCRAK
ncbi:DUF2892 domain-containing protein [Aliishimia ponticola]|uniref:DUF2892 domain-containing protein n=1 Tax=Aliishimia ponticola TaxID=2499833 RepID=A0A4V3XKU5_9RHOB|nr:DUF2892 domain-containing protein [Aliishimia ponticola]THH38343.1 DUF2892 domain-containing protein [Aliishimia ponticola]